MKILSQIPSLEDARSGFLTNYPPYGYWRREGLEEFLKRDSLNIYLHLPYCIQRCAYCYYKTETLSQKRLVEIGRYVDALCREIELAVERFDLKSYETTTVYFGGGTPTLLSETHLRRVVSVLRSHLAMSDIEFVIEAEPVTLTRQKAEVLADLGVNRISLGIQSFADEVIQATGRKDTEKQALKAIELAKGTGAIVNIDLLSGLAGESEESWDYSVRRALEVDVPCITIYKMEVYPNTEYFLSLRRDGIELPGVQSELNFMRTAVEELVRVGYEPQTFFTFGKKAGFAQRHIRNRWLGEDMYGFGVSAFGQMKGYLMQNSSDLRQYIERLEAGELPLGRGYRLSSFDRIVRSLLLGMKLVHLDHQRFQRQHGFDLTRVCARELRDLKQRGLITVDEETISLTIEGVLYGDYVGRVLANKIWRICEGEG